MAAEGSRKVPGQHRGDLVAQLSAPAVGHEELQARAPVVVGRALGVEAEHLRTRSQQRRRVLELRERLVQQRAHNLLVERSSQRKARDERRRHADDPARPSRRGHPHFPAHNVSEAQPSAVYAGDLGAKPAYMTGFAPRSREPVQERSCAGVSSAGVSSAGVSGAGVSSAGASADWCRSDESLVKISEMARRMARRSVPLGTFMETYAMAPAGIGSQKFTSRHASTPRVATLLVRPKPTSTTGVTVSMIPSPPAGTCMAPTTFTIPS